MKTFKVICIDNFRTDLKIGCIYNAEICDGYCYIIYKKDNNNEVLSQTRFRKLTLEEKREERLKEII